MNPDPTTLDRLHDVIVPPPAPFWPPAPAWYWVLAMVAIGAVWVLCAAVIAWQRSAYRREALAEWRECDELLAIPKKRGEAVTRLAVLVKRVALTVNPRENVAALTGQKWGAFLDQHGGGCTLGERLERPAYDTASVASLDAHQLQALSADVKAWILGWGAGP